MWEENRMLQSGVVRQKEVQTEFDDEDVTRVHLLVKDAKCVTRTRPGVS